MKRISMDDVNKKEYLFELMMHIDRLMSLQKQKLSVEIQHMEALRKWKDDTEKQYLVLR